MRERLRHVVVGVYLLLAVFSLTLPLFVGLAVGIPTGLILAAFGSIAAALLATEELEPPSE